MRMVCSGEVIEVGSDPDHEGMGYAVIIFGGDQGSARFLVSHEEGKKLARVLYEPITISVEFSGGEK